MGYPGWSKEAAHQYVVGIAAHQCADFIGQLAHNVTMGTMTQQQYNQTLAGMQQQAQQGIAAGGPQAAVYQIHLDVVQRAQQQQAETQAYQRQQAQMIQQYSQMPVAQLQKQISQTQSQLAEAQKQSNQEQVKSLQQQYSAMLSAFQGAQLQQLGGQEYVRTTKGDVPSWTLIPDLKNAYIPDQGPLATSSGMSLNNARMPFNNPQEYKILSIPGGWGQSYIYRFQDSSGHEVWISENDQARLQAAGRAGLNPVYWTEKSWLNHVGVSPEQVKQNMVNQMSYTGSAMQSNVAFPDKSGDYGILDKQGGRVVQPIKSQPLMGTHWGDKGTPTYMKVAQPEQQPLEWQSKVLENTGLVRTFQPASPVMAQAIARDQLIGGKQYVQTLDDKLILKTDFDKLSPDMQKVIKNQGYEAYQSKLLQDYVKLPSGEYIERDNYNKLDQRWQAILQSGGFEGYQKALDMEYAKVPQGDSYIYVSRSEIAQLPIAQQTVLKEKGMDGLNIFITENRAKLQGFIYTDDKGQEQIDILTALRSGQQPIVSNLYTDKQIADITSGKTITVTKPTNLQTTLQSIGETMQIAGESVGSPAVIEGGAKGYQQLFDMAKKELESSLSTVRSNELNQAILNDKQIQQINMTVDKAVKTGLHNIEQYTESYVMPFLNMESEAVKSLISKAPDVLKPEAAILSGVNDAGFVVPATIFYTLASATAKAGMGNVQGAAANVEKLGLGAISWFATRPAAITAAPLTEGPYTVAMLMGPERVGTMVREGTVKIMPLPQKGQSISTLGIDPSDIARVRTPPAVSPAESRQILEIIERNTTKLIGADKLPEILGKTRDQVNIQTDTGLGSGNLLVSGIQRAIPNLTFHASGGDFKDAFVRDINDKGQFTVTSVNQGRGAVEFVSPQLAGSFLKEKPAIVAQLYSAKDFKELPNYIAEDLKPGTMREARDKFYQYAFSGDLEPGIYPLVKWYKNGAGHDIVEYELMVTPDFVWNRLDAPWYARQKGVNTATTFTTSPISNPVAGLKEGQKVPIYWVASDNAIAEGRKMPTLGDLYKAEVYSTVTDMRKMLPQNIKMREITTSEEGAASSSLVSSKLKAVSIRGPEWANDPMRVMQKVNSGELQPYYRQRATAIVADQNGKIITVQERNGSWGLPGGKIESGDTSIDTIMRELKEEIGIKNPYRYQRVGALKDDRPLVTDQGAILWHDGQPVYNEHHVYLVKISREDRPIASHEVRGVDKVDFNKGLGIKKTDSYVKSVLDMVDKEAFDKFIAERSGQGYTASTEEKAPVKAERLTNYGGDESFSELPYRVKPRPIGLETELAARQAVDEIEPGIYTSYTDSVRSIQSEVSPTLMGESRISALKETEPSKPITYTSVETKPTTEIQTTKETQPYSPPTKEITASKETQPSAETHGEIPGKGYNPPMRSTPIIVPTDTVPVETPWKAPPPPPPTIIKTKKGNRLITQDMKIGAIAWKQGIMYKAWMPEYEQTDFFNTRKPIPGVKYFEGPGSAAKSIVAMYGEIPRFLHAHMGIVDINIKGQGPAQPILTFKPRKVSAGRKQRSEVRLG